MSDKSIRIARYVGIGLVVVHTVFAIYSFYVETTYAGDGQAPMVLIPLAFVDMIITIIIFNLDYVVPVDVMMHWPHWALPSIYIIGGGILWFLFPFLFLPKGYRRFWVRRKSRSPSRDDASQ